MKAGADVVRLQQLPSGKELKTVARLNGGIGVSLDGLAVDTVRPEDAETFALAVVTALAEGCRLAYFEKGKVTK